MELNEAKNLLENENIQNIDVEKLIEVIFLSETNQASKGNAWTSAFGDKVNSNTVREEIKKRGFKSRTLFYKGEPKLELETKIEKTESQSQNESKDIYEKIVKTNLEGGKKMTFIISPENEKKLEEIYSKYPGASKGAVFNALLSELI